MKQSKTLLDLVNPEKPTLLKEWNVKQHSNIRRAIVAHFMKVGEIRTSSGHRTLHIPYSFTQVDNFLGLAYTSSSNYAGLWVCNVEAISERYPLYHYVGFAIGEDGKYYAVLWDKDENEILQPL